MLRKKLRRVRQIVVGDALVGSVVSVCTLLLIFSSKLLLTSVLVLHLAPSPAAASPSESPSSSNIHVISVSPLLTLVLSLSLPHLLPSPFLSPLSPHVLCANARSVHEVAPRWPVNELRLSRAVQS